MASDDDGDAEGREWIERGNLLCDELEAMLNKTDVTDNTKVWAMAVVLRHLILSRDEDSRETDVALAQNTLEDMPGLDLDKLQNRRRTVGRLGWRDTPRWDHSRHVASGSISSG